MKKGDSVLISPEVTMLSAWVEGVVIEVETNPFVGIVISARTATGDIFFEKENLFKKVSWSMFAISFDMTIAELK